MFYAKRCWVFAGNDTRFKKDIPQKEHVPEIAFIMSNPVIGGIGMMYYGKKAEEASNEYHAQAGIPSNQSYGYPFYQAGMSGVINGLVGPGAYGCSATSGGGGFPYGSGGGWNLGGSANGAFGPFAGNGGAFGYPQGQFGAP